MSYRYYYVGGKTPLVYTREINEWIDLLHKHKAVYLPMARSRFEEVEKQTGNKLKLMNWYRSKAGILYALLSFKDQAMNNLQTMKKLKVEKVDKLCH